MKLKFFWINLVFLCLLIPHHANALPIVFEAVGWIVGSDEENYNFVADVTPLVYEVILSDLSESPFFGFDSLSVTITTSQPNKVAELLAPGITSFSADFGKTYYANVSGVGAGDTGAGLFGILVQPTSNPVPEPATMLLLGTGLVGLAGSRFRKKKK